MIGSDGKPNYTGIASRSPTLLHEETAGTMSSYENYDQTSRNYDGTRKPIGLGIILGGLAQGPKPLHEMEILDAGCGTGNYSKAVLPHVRRIDAVDLSKGMIAQASEKLKEEAAAGRISFRTASISELPHENTSCDGVMVNQVLHHLADSAAGGYPVHRRVIGHFHRVLRPGGVLLINTCSEEQLRHSFWFFDLIPEATKEMIARSIPMEPLKKLMEEVGFRFAGRMVPVDAVLQGKSYLNPLGPLDKNWRDGDSTWSLAAPEELNRGLDRVREMDKNGTLDAYVSDLDARRREIGQTTFLFASR